MNGVPEVDSSMRSYGNREAEATGGQRGMLHEVVKSTLHLQHQRELNTQYNLNASQNLSLCESVIEYLNDAVALCEHFNVFHFKSRVL